MPLEYTNKREWDR